RRAARALPRSRALLPPRGRRGLGRLRSRGPRGDARRRILARAGEGPRDDPRRLRVRVLRRRCAGRVGPSSVLRAAERRGDVPAPERERCGDVGEDERAIRDGDLRGRGSAMSFVVVAYVVAGVVVGVLVFRATQGPGATKIAHAAIAVPLWPLFGPIAL